MLPKLRINGFRAPVGGAPVGVTANVFKADAALCALGFCRTNYRSVDMSIRKVVLFNSLLISLGTCEKVGSESSILETAFGVRRYHRFPLVAVRLVRF